MMHSVGVISAAIVAVCGVIVSYLNAIVSYSMIVNVSGCGR